MPGQLPQVTALDNMLGMVAQSGKPLVLHSRSKGAYDPLDRLLGCLLTRIPEDHPVHLHCFTGGVAQAENWLCHFPQTMFGFCGGITKPGPIQDRAWEVLRWLDVDQILLESDAPYQLPLGCRRPNHPWNIIHVAEEVLRARPELGSLRAVAAYTRMNACNFYHLW